MQKDAKVRTLNAVVGRNVAELRRRRGWTQDQLAAFLRERGIDLSASALSSAWRTGRRQLTLGESVLLALAFGLAPEELTAGDGPVALTPTCRAS